VFAGVVGLACVGAGLAAAVFLATLDVVTGVFIEHPTLVWTLPVMGLLVGLVTHRWGGRTNDGMRLVIAEWREPGPVGIPAYLAPAVLAATLATHLAGGSAGREGTSVQMAAAIGDTMGRRFGFDVDDRRRLLTVAVAAGFSAVFGVPWAGAVFALEVGPGGPRRWLADTPGWTARSGQVAVVIAGSWLAHFTVLAVGVSHQHRVAVSSGRASDLGWVALAGVAFGLAAFVSVRLLETVRGALSRVVAWPPARPMLGGVVVLLLALGSGDRSTLGLSLPLLDDALAGVSIIGWLFALKIVMTAATVGSGFRGGEVTPMFVIGATLGGSLAWWWGAPATLLAAVGMVATFGAAANAPATAFVIGLELFGVGAAIPLGLGCVVARLCSGSRHLYGEAATEPAAEQV